MIIAHKYMASSYLLKLLSVFQRRHSHSLSENPDKMGKIVEANAITNFRDLLLEG